MPYWRDGIRSVVKIEAGSSGAKIVPYFMAQSWTPPRGRGFGRESGKAMGSGESLSSSHTSCSPKVGKTSVSWESVRSWKRPSGTLVFGASAQSDSSEHAQRPAQSGAQKYLCHGRGSVSAKSFHGSQPARKEGRQAEVPVPLGSLSQLSTSPWLG